MLAAVKSVRMGFTAAVIVASGIALAGLAQAGGAGAGAGAAGAGGAYKIDPVHSSVIFKIKHLGATNFYGRVNKATGSFHLQDGGSIEVNIDMNTVMSGDPKRDQHLKGPDFFSVKEFPAASFKSKSVKKTGGDMYEATGSMTLHGVTKDVTTQIEATGTGKGMRGNPIAGMEAKLMIKRSDFGMTKMVPMLGDDVELIVSLEGGQ